MLHPDVGGLFTIRLMWKTGISYFAISHFVRVCIWNFCFIAQVAFNPITVNAILKVLKKVQLIEKSKAPLESLTSIAENCLGDIRQALASLQFLCLGLDSRAPRSSNWDPGGGDAWSFETKLPSNDCKALTQSNVPETPTLGDRDLSLSLFHALGKILHNKRFNDVLAPTSAYSPSKPPLP